MTEMISMPLFGVTMKGVPATGKLNRRLSSSLSGSAAVMVPRSSLSSLPSATSNKSPGGAVNTGGRSSTSLTVTVTTAVPVLAGVPPSVARTTTVQLVVCS